MKKQRKIPGMVVEVDLRNGSYCYAQVLEHGIAFFDYRSQKRLDRIEALNEVQVLFVIAVYREVITKGIWPKIGMLPIRDEFKELPMKFIQDPVDPEKFSLYNPNTGEITPTTKDKVIGLENAAVWASSHVEERLRDHYAGRPNVWVERFKVE